MLLYIPPSIVFCILAFSHPEIFSFNNELTARTLGDLSGTQQHLLIHSMPTHKNRNRLQGFKLASAQIRQIHPSHTLAKMTGQKNHVA